MKTAKRVRTWAMAALLAALLVIPVGVGAQQTRDNDTTRGELASFDQFLDGHPNVAKELSKNPKLVDDPAYLSKHAALKDYVEDHPRVREEIKENPNAFMGRERRFEKGERKEAKHHPKPKDHDRDRDRH